MLSFEYEFLQQHQTVQFAYCVPYDYSTLLKYLENVDQAYLHTPIKSLSGLAVPVLEFTDPLEPFYNKRVILVSARVHPGESNSSHVAEGMMDYLQSEAAQKLRKQYIIYMVPMLNPDGVIAGNYRTSLFGKDLNRTFNQSRKYAFPQTYHLVELAREIKMKHKKRFCLCLDLHGHSVKKNAFMYGPDFSIQHSNYQNCRELPRLLSLQTPVFRYYSCIFRITSEKSTTARAVFNRALDIPYTYTLQSSNGFYFDSLLHTEVPFTSQKWHETGTHICKALQQLTLNQKFIQRSHSLNLDIKKKDLENFPQKDVQSDDDISQGKSDSEPENQDLTAKQLQQIEDNILGKVSLEENSERGNSPEKSVSLKYSTQDLAKGQSAKRTGLLPPINCLQRAMIFSNRHRKKQIFRHERSDKHEKLQMVVEGSCPVVRHEKTRYAVSQLVVDIRGELTRAKERDFELGMQRLPEMPERENRRLAILGGKHYSRQEILYKIKMFK